MAINEIHQGDIGTIFEITLQDADGVVDLTGASITDFVFIKPGGTKITKNGTVDADPTLGIIRYTTVSGDLDEVGCWQIQILLAFGISSSWSSDIGGFKVHSNL